MHALSFTIAPADIAHVVATCDVSLTLGTRRAVLSRRPLLRVNTVAVSAAAWPSAPRVSLSACRRGLAGAEALVVTEAAPGAFAATLPPRLAPPPAAAPLPAAALTTGAAALVLLLAGWLLLLRARRRLDDAAAPRGRRLPASVADTLVLGLAAKMPQSDVQWRDAFDSVYDETRRDMVREEDAAPSPQRAPAARPALRRLSPHIAGCVREVMPAAAAAAAVPFSAEGGATPGHEPARAAAPSRPRARSVTPPLLARKLRFQFPPTDSESGSESESESGGESGGESDAAGAIDEFWDD